MKKNIKKFCKKPLFIISLALSFVFFASLIIMISIPNGKTYVYKYKEDGFDYTYQINLGDKYECTHTFIDENGNLNNADAIKQEKYDYKVKSGKLYLVNGKDDEIEIAEINSRKLKLNFNIEDGKDSSVLVCKVNQSLFIGFAIGLCFGILLFVASCLVYLFDTMKSSAQNDNATNKK